MDDNPEQQSKEKTKHCQRTGSSLKEEFESLLQNQKSNETTDDSGHSMKQSPLVDDANKQLMDTELDMESSQPKAQAQIPQYYNTQATLPTFVDRSTIQSDDDQKQIAKVTINQQVGDIVTDNNDQNEAKQNPAVQALFNGTLPDDFYILLMSVMGIQECLISNRLVCSFWDELVLERCHNQKSLKLFETFDCLMEYGEFLLKYEKIDDTSLILKSIGDDLLFEGLETDREQFVRSMIQKDIEKEEYDDTEEENTVSISEDDEKCQVETEMSTLEKKLEASKVLTTLFPAVEELVLWPEYYTRINVKHLLKFYAKQLTSLTMNSFDDWIESFLSDLSFPKLKSLNTFLFSPRDDQLLSLLPQLESLTLSRTEISLETLLRTGTQLQELSMLQILSLYTTPEDAFSKRPPIETNLRKFTFRINRDRLPAIDLKFISLNLTSLTFLKIIFARELGNNPHIGDLTSVTSYLVPLQQLHSLTLEAPVSFFLLDDNQLSKIQPLPSVRHLKLLLWDYAPLSMDLFSRALFAVFPKLEQVLIAFSDQDSRLDSVTLTAFEDFAGKHPNVVQLFRSKNMSKFTRLPNAVSPLLGRHRQVYEEYIEEEDLFGVAICKLSASLVTRQGEKRPNLKDALRPADRLTAMSNLLQLLDRHAFTLLDYTDNDGWLVYWMIHRMIECALQYGPSQVALSTLTCKCVLSLFYYRVVDTSDSDTEKPYLDTRNCDVYSFFEMMLKLLEHYKTQPYNDKELLRQMFKLIVQLIVLLLIEKKVNSFIRHKNKLTVKDWFKVLLKLADYYKTEQLKVLDNNKELLLQIRNLMDNQLQKFSKHRLGEVISEFIGSENRVYRVEMARALLRCCKSTTNCFK